MNSQLKYIFKVILYMTPVCLFTKVITQEVSRSGLNPFVLFGISLTMALVTLPYDWGLGAYFLRGGLK